MIVTRGNIEKGLEALEHSELLHGDELYHYGRKGMKWYQHIFGDIDPRAKYKAYMEKKEHKKQRAEEIKIANAYRVDKRNLPPFKNAEESNQAFKRRMEEERKIFDMSDGHFPRETFEQTIPGIVAKSSGDYYGSNEGLTDTFREHYKKANEIRKKYDKLTENVSFGKMLDLFGEKSNEMRDLSRETAGKLLKDLGYEDTKESRELLYLEIYEGTKNKRVYF